VDDLVKQELVRRGRDPHDRRRYALEVTGRGREALAVTAEAVRELADDMAALLGPGGEDELRQLLVRIESSVGADPAAPAKESV
jgi:DNA-binding MarR family transcriptional regulator